MIYHIMRKYGHACKSSFLQVYLFCAGRIASRIQKPKKYREDYPIDFVVTWLDDSDPEWIKEKQKYAGEMREQASNIEARYRDWDTLVYWFRAVEKYAPWVNRVYLVTCGHKPSWLNLQNEKLTLVAHKDFMPKEYLPTFNCNSIELNMWRIPGLSEHFVYFNDDMFLNRPVDPEDFFENGLPRECAIAKPIHATRKKKGADSALAWKHALLNDYSVINSSFDIRRCIRRDPEKWFSYVIGSNAKYNRRLYTDGYLAGMVHPHVTRSFLKKAFVDLWNNQGKVLDETSKSRFRSSNNITDQLVALWMLFSGDFSPTTRDQLGKLFLASPDSVERFTEELLTPKYNVICYNDGAAVESEEFDEIKKRILDAFAEKLPEKSSFEI